MKREGDTKQKLLDVAMQLLWEQSYGSVGVDDICKKAGVTKGSFYFAFPSKADLAVAAFEEYWTKHKRPILDTIFSAQVPPVEQFENFCAFIVKDQTAKYEEFGKMCGCPGTSVGCEVSTQDEKIRSALDLMCEKMLRYTTASISALQSEGLIAKDEDPKMIARQVYDFTVGLLTQAKIENDPAALQRLRPGMFRILGLKVSQPAPATV
ncbi:transcriptional regulator, TetR family [Verrucomicrobium sp. GAS474]|uniref:TetR/AcrR family transcriptional regulator n=1 Tax=Verrucomicrobium sp. GAS474 TaxID=1882831 RepID=UPI00087A427E|nr:TetR/AcrR family transcriptional regulator [Verrucomicrobium sp. GAS474]SDT92319.1 transcriptional regulator, TetR family [Verrucomicrobium sp. GAS474]